MQWLRDLFFPFDFYNQAVEKLNVEYRKHMAEMSAEQKRWTEYYQGRINELAKTLQDQLNQNSQLMAANLSEQLQKMMEEKPTGATQTLGRIEQLLIDHLAQEEIH